jgi:hypothetical protein
MDSIFTLPDDEEDSGNTKLNIDELFERKKEQSQKTVALYNKLLQRIHAKIRLASRQRNADQFCWFLIPEMMIGIPRYDSAECTAYLIGKLKENGFLVRYTHPNMLFISWQNYFPHYVRQEVKKKLGKVIDQFGQEVVEEDEATSPAALMTQPRDKEKEKKNVRPISSYEPTGLIYNQSLLKMIEDKTR